MADHSVVIAILTWFGGHTLYNRFYLKKRGLEVFPIPRCHRPPGVHLPQPISSSDGSAQVPRRSWSAPWKRRSQRAGYNHLRQDPNEEDHLAARFSLDDDDVDEDDARVLGGEMEAWRRSGDEETSRPSASASNGETVGVHQGLVRL